MGHSLHTKWLGLCSTLATVICLALSTAADAEDSLSSGWQICNQNEEKIWYAVSYVDASDGEWVTRYWFPVDVGECSIVQDTITNRYAYYYATTAFGYVYSGEKPLCVTMLNNGGYRGDGDNCLSELRNFREVDFNGYRARTLTLE